MAKPNEDGSAKFEAKFDEASFCIIIPEKYVSDRAFYTWRNATVNGRDWAGSDKSDWHAAESYYTNISDKIIDNKRPPLVTVPNEYYDGHRGPTIIIYEKGSIDLNGYAPRITDERREMLESYNRARESGASIKA